MNIRANLENPNFFQDKILAPHAEYKNLSQVREQSLNGEWYFNFVASCDTGENEQRSTPKLCEKWSKISVPAHINLCGYGSAQYLNTAYPWDGVNAITPPYLPSQIPTGQYMLKCELSAPQNGEHVILRFEGVEPAFALWLNGEYFGYSEDSFTPCEFDITSAIKNGTNYIYVEVYRYCTGLWLEDQDFWRFCGIFRDVKLRIMPKTYAKDIFVKANAEGELNIEIEAHDAKSVCANLYSPKGELVYTATANCENERAVINSVIKSAMLWSAEKPNLYKLLIDILDSEKTQQQCEIYVGFRSIKIVDGIFTINNKRAILRGVNRHEWNMQNGRVITDEDMITDAILMKKHNINAVRASHYPNNSKWYDICDQIGLYVIDEVNLETHGTWSIVRKTNHVSLPLLPDDVPEFKNAVLQRAQNMLQRDKNHPCIIMWSCGNESMGGSTIYEEANLLRSLDNTRPIHYEGIAHDDRFADTTDVISTMYLSPKECENIMQDRQDKPFMQCEYMHAMGNSCGNATEYVALEKYPHYIGGFVWDWIDQLILCENELRYGGEFNELTHSGDFCANGLVFANREITPKLLAIKFAYSPFKLTLQKDGIHILNKHLFTDADEFSLIVNLLQDGEIIDTQTICAKCAPGSEAFVPFQPKLPVQGEIALQAKIVTKASTKYISAGEEIASGETILRTRAAANTDWRIENGCEYVGFYGNNITAIFSYAKGCLITLQIGDKPWLTAPFTPMFWRAIVSNDVGSKFDVEKGIWKAASLYQNVIDFTVKEDGTAYVVSAVYELATTPKAYFTMNYFFEKDEKIRITCDMSLPQNMPAPFCFGLACATTLENKIVNYYGAGAHETAPDRKEGALLGRWTLDACKELTPYMTLQDCALRSEVRFFECGGITFTAQTPFYFSALNYTCHEIENAAHQNNLPPASKTVLRILANECGVGGDDTWGARPHEQYLMNEKALHLEFTISPK